MVIRNPLLDHKDATKNGSIFKLHSEYQPTGDQPQAIEALVKCFKEGNQFQTLLGVTCAGKTFTMKIGDFHSMDGHAAASLFGVVA